MANIKVKVDYSISDGTKLKFRTPCESTEVEGLVVTYPITNGVGYALKTFRFVDAHGTELSGVGNVFTSDVLVEVLLDVTKGRAFIKNADTNSYIEDIKITVKRIEEERKEIFAEAGKSIQECNDATKSANEAANTLKVTAEEIRSGGFVEALKEINDGRKFTFWIGTHKEYEEDLANGVNFTDTFCVIEDDTTEEDIKQSIESLQEGVKDLQETSETLEVDIETLKEDIKTLEEDAEGKAPSELVEEVIGGKEFDTELDRIYKDMPENSARHIVVNASGSSLPFYGGNAHLTIYKATDEYGSIHAYEYLGNYPTALEWTRNLERGTWYNWCFVNPPKWFGVGYRTNEMWNGYPVYTKVVQLGYLPNTNYLNINLGVPCDKILSYEITIKRDTGNATTTLPVFDDKGVCAARSYCQNNNIYIQTFNSEMAAYIGFCTIKYYK